MGRPWTPRTYKRDNDKLYKITTQWTIGDDLCHSAHFVWAHKPLEAMKKLALVFPQKHKVLDFRVVDTFDKTAEDALLGMMDRYRGHGNAA